MVKQKKKSGKEKKIEKGLREPFGPVRGTSPRPIYSFPNRYPSFSLPLTDRGPHLSASSPPPFPLSLLEMETAGVTPLPRLNSRDSGHQKLPRLLL
jgi:hypothetical protein